VEVWIVRLGHVITRIVPQLLRATQIHALSHAKELKRLDQALLNCGDEAIASSIRTKWKQRLKKKLDIKRHVAVLSMVLCSAGCEVFTAVTMKNAAFCKVAPRGFIINRRFGGTCRLHLQGRRNNASEEKCWVVPNSQSK
jgi:hypothetical protein